MTCSIAALIACFSWSGFYVDGGMVVADAGNQVTTIESVYERYQGEYRPLIQYRAYTDEPINPYARVSLGYEVHFSPWLSASLQLTHQSSVATGRDRGVNSASFSLRWYPFRRH